MELLLLFQYYFFQVLKSWCPLLSFSDIEKSIIRFVHNWWITSLICGIFLILQTLNLKNFWLCFVEHYKLLTIRALYSGDRNQLNLANNCWTGSRDWQQSSALVCRNHSLSLSSPTNYYSATFWSAGAEKGARLFR